MAQYTVSTAPAEEALLDFILERRSAWGLPLLTKDQLVGMFFHGAVAQKYNDIKNDDAGRIHRSVDDDATTGQQKAQIRAILGLP